MMKIKSVFEELKSHIVFGIKILSPFFLILLCVPGYTQTELVWSQSDLEKATNESAYIVDIADYGNDKMILFGQRYASSNPRERNMFPEFYVVSKKNRELLKGFSWPSNIPGHIMATKVLADKSFMLCLYSTINPNTTIIARVDVNGNIVWLKSYGSELNNASAARQAIFSETGECYFTSGFTDDVKGTGDIPDTTHGGGDALVYKVNKNGEILWQKVFGSSGYDYGIFDALGLDGDQNLHLLGHLNGKFIEFDHDFAEAKPNGFFNFQLDTNGELVHKNFYEALDEDSNQVFNFPLDQALADGFKEHTISYFGNIKHLNYLPANYPTADTLGRGDACVITFSLVDTTYDYLPFGASGRERIWDITTLENGNMVCVGETDSQELDRDGDLSKPDAWLVLLNPDMEVIYSQSFFYDSNKSFDDRFRGIARVGENQVVAFDNGKEGNAIGWLNYFDFNNLTSIEEKNYKNEIVVSPNPVLKGELIRISGAKQKIKVSLIDNQGRIMPGILNTTNGFIGTKHFESAMYHIKIQDYHSDVILYQGKIIIN